MEPPDILLIGAAWRPRALLRAELLERGFEVFAVESGGEAEPFLGARRQPLLVIIDLDGDPDPRKTLTALKVAIRPERILALTAAGALPPAAIRALGVPAAISRPFSINDVVSTAGDMVRRAREMP